MQRLLITFILILCIRWSAGAQVANVVPGSIADTISINLEEAERQFVSNNLLLLSKKYQIDASKAAIVQASLFPNPTISLEQNIYNNLNNRYFDATRSGQNIVEYQQLILLAGKRKKAIQLEQLNAQMTELEYFDLLRSLRFELRTTFYELGYLLQNQKLYTSKIAPIAKLVQAMEGQYQKGNIALKEVVRLKALLFSLENERLSLQNQIHQKEADIKLLTGAKPNVVVIPVFNLDNLQDNLANYNASLLLETATASRPDLKIFEINIKQQETNYSFQKALATPDLVLGGIYDRQGSFIRNYTGLQVSMPLPIYNRNQGNISAAKSLISKSKTDYEHYQKQVAQEVWQAYLRAQETDRLASNYNQNFTRDFDKLLEGVTNSFGKRNISLIEFTDYYETYTESLTQLLQLKMARIQALESINHIVGQPIITY
ncbi:TolC family protein [Adhaeribacter aquaticus]|uniref:TolC family protein n=1 Tax=Adhaeribacter aquaticus TaxID=299567 RepID=UPI000419CD14|nr:TolC family protein [Adhaeribacter aquaticus]